MPNWPLTSLINHLHYKKALRKTQKGNKIFIRAVNIKPREDSWFKLPLPGWHAEVDGEKTLLESLTHTDTHTHK